MARQPRKPKGRRSAKEIEIDKHIGQRVRERRIVLGLSQTVLAEGLGISFQQLQKYESGANRISASRLYQIALVLGVPVQYFFQGADTLASKTAARDAPGKQAELGASAISAVAALSRIPSQGVRKSFVQLARAISQSAEVNNDGT